MTTSSYNCKALAKLIPPFGYPASDWCFRITSACKALDQAIDFDFPETSRVLLPLIIAALPVNLLRVATLAPLSKLLEWLDEYDKPVISLEESLECHGIPVGVKPSIYFAQKFGLIQMAMPKGTAKKTIETLAWSTIRTNLPSQLRAAILLLDPLKVPDTATWNRLDEAMSVITSQSNSTSVVAASSSDGPDQRSYLDQINALEAEVAHLKDSTNNKRLTCFKCGNEGHMARSCTMTGPGSARGRQEELRNRPHSGPLKWNTPVHLNSDNSLCFYHSRFGRSAQKCTQPCSWQGNY